MEKLKAFRKMFVGVLFQVVALVAVYSLVAFSVLGLYKYMSDAAQLMYLVAVLVLTGLGYIGVMIFFVRGAKMLASANPKYKLSAQLIYAGWFWGYIVFFASLIVLYLPYILIVTGHIKESIYLILYIYNPPLIYILELIPFAFTAVGSIGFILLNIEIGKEINKRMHELVAALATATLVVATWVEAQKMLAGEDYTGLTTLINTATTIATLLTLKKDISLMKKQT